MIPDYKFISILFICLILYYIYNCMNKQNKNIKYISDTYINKNDYLEEIKIIKKNNDIYLQNIKMLDKRTKALINNLDSEIEIKKNNNIGLYSNDNEIINNSNNKIEYSFEVNKKVDLFNH